MVAHGPCLPPNQFLLLESTEPFSLENLIVQISNRENLIGPTHHNCLSWERTFKVRWPHALPVLDCPTMRGRDLHQRQPVTVQLCIKSASSLCPDWKLPKLKAWTVKLCYTFLYHSRTVLKLVWSMNLLAWEVKHITNRSQFQLWSTSYGQTLFLKVLPLTRLHLSSQHLLKIIIVSILQIRKRT